MSYWKDTLCFLVVLVIWGIAGHLDYEDAVALEKAAHEQALQPCAKPGSQVLPSASGAASTNVLRKQPQRPCAPDDGRKAPP